MYGKSPALERISERNWSAIPMDAGVFAIYAKETSFMKHERAVVALTSVLQLFVAT